MVVRGSARGRCAPSGFGARPPARGQGARCGARWPDDGVGESVALRPARWRRISSRCGSPPERSMADQRRVGFAFAQVVADVLSHEFGAVAFVVQQVVDDLERRAQGAPVAGGRPPRRASAPPSTAPRRALGLEQFGGLEADHAQVVGDRRSGRACSSAAGPRPSAMTLVASARTSSTRMRPTDTIIWKAREYRKSPTSTLAALPKIALAVARPRRSSDDRRRRRRAAAWRWDELDDRGQVREAVGPWVKPSAPANSKSRGGCAAAGGDDVGEIWSISATREASRGDDGIDLRASPSAIGSAAGGWRRWFEARQRRV